MESRRFGTGGDAIELLPDAILRSEADRDRAQSFAGTGNAGAGGASEGKTQVCGGSRMTCGIPGGISWRCSDGATAGVRMYLRDAIRIVI